jgi:DNA-binding GntR family transcriptional regulator
LGTEAAAILREAILDGRLPQGERVNEVGISRRLGISRGPLREALRRLEQDGLVESSPYKGTSIVRVTAQDVLDVLNVRKLIEPYAVQEAAERGRDALLETLTGMMSEMREAARKGDPYGVAGAHGRFHGAFYSLSGNVILGRLWGRLEDPVRLYLLRRQTTFGDMSDVAEAHRVVVQLLEQGNKTALKSEVLGHLDINLRTIRRLLKEGNDSEGAQDAPPGGIAADVNR